MWIGPEIEDLCTTVVKDRLERAVAEGYLSQRIVDLRDQGTRAGPGLMEVDDPVLRCVAPGMPEAMTYIGPHPVEFVELSDGDIEIRIESDDNVRVVHMSEDASAAGQPPSALGYSIGRWEDDVLVVTTTRLNWPYFKVFGLVAAPQSESMEIVERFELDRAEGTLTYSFTATDPATFTETVTAEAYHVWRYRPGTTIEPYDCTLDE